MVAVNACTTDKIRVWTITIVHACIAAAIVQYPNHTAVSSEKVVYTPDSHLAGSVLSVSLFEMEEM